MRKTFDSELQMLNLALIEMASIAEEAIDLAIVSLEKRDNVAAATVLEKTNAMKEMEREIEHLCLKLLLSQQPVAKDLRVVSTALKMITDLERIGAQAGDIAEISRRINGQQYIKELIRIPRMARIASEMVKRSIYSYVRKNIHSAREVIARDDDVDELFVQIKSDLVDLIIKDRSNADQAIELIMIIKYLERIADHAVNIAEWTIFCVTGEHG